MNLRKIRIDKLLKSTLTLNSIINKYTDEKILKMNKSGLIMTCYDLLSYEHDTKVFREYVIKDIKDHIYILEGQDVNFKWVEEIPDTSYNLPNTIYKKITHYESFKIVDYRVMCEKSLDEKEKLCYEVDLYTLLPEKLDAFYDEFMKMVNKDSIFVKLKYVKEELLK